MATFKEFEVLAWEKKAKGYVETWGEVCAQTIGPLLDRLEAGPGTELLDCGAGPGTLAASAAARGAAVTGCDYSEEMLSIARQRHPGIRFDREDAENLSYSPDSFDAVAMNFLLLHVGDPEKVLRECARVLRPGGRLGYTLWLPPDQSAGLGIIFDALKRFADFTVLPPAPDQFTLADPAFATRVLEGLGFSSVTAEVCPIVWRVSSGDHFFRAVQAGTRMGGLVDLQRPEVKEQIRSYFVEALESWRAPDGCVIPTPAVLIGATKR